MQLACTRTAAYFTRNRGFKSCRSDQNSNDSKVLRLTILVFSESCTYLTCRWCFPFLLSFNRTALWQIGASFLDDRHLAIGISLIRVSYPAHQYRAVRCPVIFRPPSESNLQRPGGLHRGRRPLGFLVGCRHLGQG